MASAPSSTQASICSEAGSMNMLTRMPPACNRSTVARKVSTLRATSRPPSVVTSLRFSGTRQTSSGKTCNAVSRMSGVFPISRLSFVYNNAVAQPKNISVLDMPAVRTQVHSDPMRTGSLAGGCGRQDIRLHVRCVRHVHIPDLAQCCDVIDVDPELDHGN